MCLLEDVAIALATRFLHISIIVIIIIIIVCIILKVIVKRKL